MSKSAMEITTGKPALLLPRDFVTQTAALLAKRGKGKSYLAMVVAEEMTDAGLPWVALDPMGIWYGLRAGADGSKRGGLPVLILGGDHGDKPLDPGAGAVVAEFVAANRIPTVLDTSRMRTVRERCAFVADFLERLLAVNRQAMHVFLEEADEAAPQTSRSPDQERSREQVDRLIRRGRSPAALGGTLISQRPAVLDKNPLSQTELLAVLGFTAPQDIDAVTDWFKAHGIVGPQLADVRASLPKLRMGQAVISSPDFLNVFDTYQIRQKRTFDSSRTMGASNARSAPRSLADAPLEELADAMANAVDRAEQNDPTALRRRLADVQQKLAQVTAEATRLRDRAPAAGKVQRVTVPVMTETQLGRVSHAAASMDNLLAAFREVVEEFQTGQTKVVERVVGEFRALKLEVEKRTDPLTAKAYESVYRTAATFTPAATTIRAPRPDPVPPAGTSNGDGGQIKAGARRILAVLAQLHPTELSWGELGGLAKLKMTGGTWGAYVRQLKAAGLIVEHGDAPHVTAKGMAFLGAAVPPPPANATEAVALWTRHLKAGARAMARAIIERPRTREQLGEATGIAPSGGTFGAYLRILLRNGVVLDGPDGVLRPNAAKLMLDRGPVDWSQLEGGGQ